MKASTLSLVAFIAFSSVLISNADALTFKVRTVNGVEQWYQLDVDPNLPKLKAPEAPSGAQANDYADAYGYAPDRKYPPQAAEIAAVGWAGGLQNNEPDPFAGNTEYVNSSTDLGGKKPGGFYNACNIKVDSAQLVSSPVPYYLVKMEGDIGGSRQTFYAAVLESGDIVRPVAVSGPEKTETKPAHHRQKTARR